jgi:hypothetical protein
VDSDWEWGAVGRVGNLGKEKKKGGGTAKQESEELEELEDEVEAEEGAGTAVGDSGQGDTGGASCGGALGDSAVANAGVKPVFPLPTKQNPMISALYGQLCIVAKSYQSGIGTLSFYSLLLIILCSSAASSPSPACVQTISRGSSDLSLLGSSGQYSAKRITDITL